MTSKDNGGNDPSPPDRTGDVMDLLIGWRAGGKEAAGKPATERNAEKAAKPGPEAVSVPAPDPAAATMAALAAGQRRILALLEDLAPKQAEAPAGEAATDLQEAATAIQAATEWASDIRAATLSLRSSVQPTARRWKGSGRSGGARGAGPYRSWQLCWC